MTKPLTESRKNIKGKDFNGKDLNHILKTSDETMKKHETVAVIRDKNDSSAELKE